LTEEGLAEIVTVGGLSCPQTLTVVDAVADCPALL
jgi:hypothetical protein